MFLQLCYKETICILLLASVAAGFIMSKCKNVPYARGQFLYSVKNTIAEPKFFHTINMTIDTCNDTVLLKYMELACDTHKETFRNFSQTYFSGLGYYVSAFNGVSEMPGETYWELIEHTTGKQHPVGVHHFIPQHGDHVAWNLTIIGWTKYTTHAVPTQNTTSVEPLQSTTSVQPLENTTPIEPLQKTTPAEPLHDTTPAEPLHDTTPAEPLHDTPPAEPLEVGK